MASLRRRLTRGPVRRVLLALGALGLALVAQGELSTVARGEAGSLALGGGLFVLAGLLWLGSYWRGSVLGALRSLLAGLWRGPRRLAYTLTPVRSGPRLVGRRARALVVGWLLIGLTAVVGPLLLGPRGGGFALLRYPDGPGAGYNSLTMPGLLLWLAGTALVGWALADRAALRTAVRRWWDGRTLRLRIDRAWLLVLGITVVAAVFRFYALPETPPEMTSDHTEKFMDIRRILDGTYPVFMHTNAGREPIQFYLTALALELGAPWGFTTLKAVMAAISTLTIPLVYLLGREVGGARAGRPLGLLAALVAAVMPWHVQITRIALRIALAPFFAALAAVLLLRALRTGRRNDWLGLGLTIGVGVYGYSGFRPMVLAAAGVIVLKLAADAFLRVRASRPVWPVLRTQVTHVAAAAGLAIALGVPMIRYALDAPDAFWYRTRTRATGLEVPLERPPAEQFAINFRDALLMFNYTHDSAWFHSPPGRPALEDIGGALVVLGWLSLLVGALYRRSWRYAALLVIAPTMLLSSAMALAFPRENPSLTRAAGAIPVVSVMVALPVAVLGARLRTAGRALGRPRAGTVGFALLAVLLFVTMAGNSWHRYFVTYHWSYLGNTHPTGAGADVLRGFVELGGDLEHAYLVSWPHGWDYRLLAMRAGVRDGSWHNVLEGTGPSMEGAVEAARAHAADPTRKLYIVGGPPAQHNLDVLREIYPDAQVTEHRPPGEGRDFWSVYVPGQPARREQPTSEPAP